MAMAVCVLQPCPRACSGLGAGISGYSVTQRPSLVMSSRPFSRVINNRRKTGVVIRAAIQEQEELEKKKPEADVEETTRKRGLEAGLWQIFTSKGTTEDGTTKSKANQAKDLLTRYGGAYLATSVTLSLISFGLCFVLVNNGVDVPALLEKVGIHPSETGEKVGTFALAYAAHKAASPIRFPPTVALTPIVAGWFGKKPAEVAEDLNKD